MSRTDRALGEALIEAAGDGDVQVLEEMLSAGLDVNMKVDGDGSALIAAAKKGQFAAIKFLLERGADVNMGVEGDGNPLIMAAANGHTAAVTLLLERGADIEAVVDGDENALIQAAESGHLEVVKLLVGRGANVNASVRVDSNFNGQPKTEYRTPLSMARRGGHAAVVAFLQSAGARPVAREPAADASYATTRRTRLPRATGRVVDDSAAGEEAAEVVDLAEVIVEMSEQMQQELLRRRVAADHLLTDRARPSPRPRAKRRLAGSVRRRLPGRAISSVVGTPFAANSCSRRR